MVSAKTCLSMAGSKKKKQKKNTGLKSNIEKRKAHRRCNDWGKSAFTLNINLNFRKSFQTKENWEKVNKIWRCETP